MAAFIKTRTLARFLLSFGAAAAAAMGLVFFFSGPRLGPHYDFLMRYRPAPPLSHELVLIETGRRPPDNTLEPAALASVLMICTEMEASALVLQTPALVLPGGGNAREQLLTRFDEEFALMEGNIRSLFQAIRLGSVSPAEAERYVGDLVGLTGRGKERLIAALEQGDGADISLIEKAAAAYGNLWEAGDFNALEGKPQRDQDGVFRRIIPALSDEAGTEHIIYALLKQRYDTAGIGDTGAGQVLFLAKNGENIFLPLDDRGALLPELPREEDFRRLPLERFLDYERRDGEMYRLLAAAEAQGLFAPLAPEDYPTAWYRQAQNAWEDLLDSPSQENRSRWLEARSGYLEVLNNFIYGDAETALLADYEKLIASESIGEAGIGRVVSLRNDLISRFKELRETYEGFIVQRDELRGTLVSSLGILGPPKEPGSKNPSDAEISAILANTLLIGRALVPQANRYIVICALAAAFIISLCLCRLNLSSSLFTGFVLTALAGLFFCWGFVLTGYWLDPLIPSGAMAAGMLASCIGEIALHRRQVSQFRRAYGSIIAQPYLQEVIRAGRPIPGEIIKAKAGVVAIRGAGIITTESNLDPRESAWKTAEFRINVAELFMSAGAVVAGFDGDMALVVFGSPLERVALGRMNQETPYEDDERAHGNHTPIAKAVGFITELLRTVPETASWYFGLDTAEAAFSYSPVTGYMVSGPPVVRARILSNLAPRYKARIVITSRVYEKIETMPLRRLDILADRSGGNREPFYELILKPGS